ncbi:DNA (cytosine-5)-methyltransferase 3A [Patella vulgata]|uniref:DNA (cytosine-5)-methyltransferase 3A n=1 Tax=Patella vulgata TaxID=6465 RepID=UPI0024A9FB4E|nr:DNA (cytosine-5)-methyltransferase 3A [Patella vulgata]
MMFVAPMDSKGDQRRDKTLREHPAKRQLFQILPKTPKKNQKGKAELEKKKNDVDETKNNDDIKSLPSAKCKQKKHHIEVIEEGDEVIDIEEQLGRLVFANLAGLQWWPGLIVKGSMCNLYTEDIGCSWVYWFGDHKVSLVTHERIIPFLANFNDKCHGKGKMFQKALIESIHIFGSRCGLKIDSLSDDYLLAWAKRGFKFKPHDQRTKAETACDIPETVTIHLKMIGDDVLKKVANKSVPKSKGVKQQKPDTRENAIEAVKEGKCLIQDVCIGCSELNVELVDQHPLFKGGVCGNCKSDVLETMFALDEDNNNAFCSICGCGGTLFVCDKDTCNRVYCVDCIDEMAGSEILEKIEKVSKWECFLCMPYHKSSHGLLQPRHDWRQRIVQFFETEVIDQIPNFDHLKKKKPLRVLSLFDGIGTGILVLKELGLEIEEYHASEIDQDAIMVTSVHHGDQVKQIGDVTSINENMISKLLPVDLLIGGSPCNDLSIANPDKKGFDFGGTGILFFDFVRILEIIRKQQTKERHLFWLYENVASMKLEYKKVISRFLKCPAARWDSLYFSAQNRSRYFWGNIPGLYSTPAISTSSHQRVTLNSCLAQNCNREATVDRIRTVTTRTNSLRLGKDDKGFPVKMDGMDAGIWIPELERVFGFPSHYTDVGNLPPTRRQKLLGKSWSVTVLKNILMPLKQYYACSEEQK